jgi:poly(3-hydroxybutyrate) depolymerase
MYEHAPAKVPAGPRPLVVVLHGCTQIAAAYESAGWSDLADEWALTSSTPSRIRLGTPAVTTEALDLDEIARGQGENESIKEMIAKMKVDHSRPAGTS